MSDMLKMFVKKELENIIAEKYAHIRHPAGVYAKVTEAKDNVYTLQILDEAKKADVDYPQYPGIRSGITLEKGDIAAVMFLYGGSSIYIAGRVRP